MQQRLVASTEGPRSHATSPSPKVPLPVRTVTRVVAVSLIALWMTATRTPPSGSTHACEITPADAVLPPRRDALVGAAPPRSARVITSIA